MTHYEHGPGCTLGDEGQPCDNCRRQYLTRRNCTPELRVHSDYDGYFEQLVDRWIQRKRNAGGRFKHTAVKITAGPYRADAVTTTSKDGVLHLDFYSALRTGFGSLSEDEIDEIIELM
jgi:hypothetical protein